MRHALHWMHCPHCEGRGWFWRAVYKPLDIPTLLEETRVTVATVEKRKEDCAYCKTDGVIPIEGVKTRA